MRPYTLPFSSLGRHDVADVGGKNSSLGEMISNLAALGVTAAAQLRVVRLDPPAQRQKGVVVKDAAELVAALRQKGLLQ